MRACCAVRSVLPCGVRVVRVRVAVFYSYACAVLVFNVPALRLFVLVCCLLTNTDETHLYIYAV